MCVCSCIYTHMCAGTHRGEKATDPLKLELQLVVSCLIWVRHVEPGSSERAALNHLSSPFAGNFKLL